MCGSRLEPPVRRGDRLPAGVARDDGSDQCADGRQAFRARPGPALRLADHSRRLPAGAAGGGRPALAAPLWAAQLGVHDGEGDGPALPRRPDGVSTLRGAGDGGRRPDAADDLRRRGGAVVTFNPAAGVDVATTADPQGYDTNGDGTGTLIEDPPDVLAHLVSNWILGNWRSEERRVGKECRSRWSPYH